MNKNMEYEIEKTILKLKASMPEQKQQASFISLLKLAASEVNMAFLALMLIAVIMVGVLLSTTLATPMLTAFCTAPMPALLLFHQYVLRGNEQMRELERTFKYSYCDMLSARTTVISIYMLLCLLCLSFTIYQIAGESFLRLALCGAAPSTLLCSALLWASYRFPKQDNIAFIAIIFWLFLSFAAMALPFNAILQAAHTGLYAFIVAVGIALFGLCLKHIRTGGSVYAASTR